MLPPPPGLVVMSCAAGLGVGLLMEPLLCSRFTPAGASSPCSSPLLGCPSSSSQGTAGGGSRRPAESLVAVAAPSVLLERARCCSNAVAASTPGKRSDSPSATATMRNDCNASSSSSSIRPACPGSSRTKRLRRQPQSPSAGSRNNESLGAVSANVEGTGTSTAGGGAEGRTTVELPSRCASMKETQSFSRKASCTSKRTEINSSGDTISLQTGHRCQVLPLYSRSVTKYRMMQGAQKTCPHRVIFGTMASTSKQMGHLGFCSHGRSTCRTLSHCKSESALNAASTTSSVSSST
mmetsp:Transcript_71952/g.142764  ORF Transcript_71952/g.142764 Transcript_71952/m.142764 type:complete len:294 (-) Transcript_71952:440-1321(-)